MRIKSAHYMGGPISVDIFFSRWIISWWWQGGSLLLEGKLSHTSHHIGRGDCHTNHSEPQHTHTHTHTLTQFTYPYGGQIIGNFTEFNSSLSKKSGHSLRNFKIICFDTIFFFSLGEGGGKWWSRELWTRSMIYIYGVIFFGGSINFSSTEDDLNQRTHTLTHRARDRPKAQGGDTETTSDSDGNGGQARGGGRHGEQAIYIRGLRGVVELSHGGGEGGEKNYNILLLLLMRRFWKSVFGRLVRVWSVCKSAAAECCCCSRDVSHFLFRRCVESSSSLLLSLALVGRRCRIRVTLAMLRGELSAFREREREGWRAVKSAAKNEDEVGRRVF